MKTVKSILSCFTLALAFHAHSKDAQSEWWWNEAWWNTGHIIPPKNYETETRWISYKSRGQDIPAMLIRPKQKGRFYPVLFQHGRRGLDEMVQRHARRLAARGFVVLAPDIYKGNFIGAFPIEHDYKLEQDVNQALTVLLQRKDIIGKKACLYSHTRGGYYTLKTAVTFKRQQRDAACYVSYYPHLQDPNAPEPLQVYAYAPEVNDLKIPVLIFIGDREQYQRRRVIESSVKALQDRKRDVRLVLYPGVGRGFDFRPPNVRTFADDLASKDAIQRAARFIRKVLGRQ